MSVAKKIRAAPIGSYAAMSLSAIFALSFIGFDIIKAADVTWGDLFSRPHHAVGTFSVFTHVRAGKVTVVTQKEYHSSNGKNPTGQWCYVERIMAGGSEVHLHVHLDDFSRKGIFRDAMISVQDLSLMGLTQAEFTALRDKCRFE